MTKTALVLGASGGIGGEVTRRLLKRGWRVRALDRDPTKEKGIPEAVERIRGDALNVGDVMSAAEGVQLIVHAVNPPGYKNWGQVVLPMIDNTIKAAQANGARILLPGTIYNYGPSAFPHISEDSPQEPLSKKGAIRVELERRLREGSEQGAPALILRAGDYFGPRPGGNWFSDGMIRPGRPVRVINNPSRAGVGHQWAYLPDVAEAMVQLVERGESLDDFATFQFKGHWDDDGTKMATAIARVVGEGRVKHRAFPWWVTTLLAPFVRLFRELKEVRHLWETPARMDNHRLVAKLGAEPHTPLDDAIRETLEGLGCLPAALERPAILSLKA